MNIKPLLVPLLFLSLATANLAEAQSNWIIKKLLLSEKNFEDGMKLRFKEYEMIKEVRSFPDRLNATNKVKFSTKPPGAIVTLHDIKTGEPLESCKTPCELSVDYTTLYVAGFYKFGYQYNHYPIKHGDDFPETWLGKNYLDVAKKHRQCQREFKARPLQDADVKPCVRVPPVMPAQATKSGHCKMIFDVSKIGRPTNIRATQCTEPHFENPSIESVSWWFYNPKVERGTAVSALNIESKMSFRLTNEDGKIIDELGVVVEAE